MQKLEVLIEENAFGSARPVEVAADVPVSALVPALVEELQLPQTDLFGKRLVYMLRQAPGGPILPDNATLESSGIGAGARLSLDSYVIDGSVASMVQAAPPIPRGDPGLYSSPTIADVEDFVAVGRRNTSARLAPLTSGQLRSVKRTSGRSRRAFLVLTGAVLGASAVGVGYAAYSAWKNGALNGTIMAINPKVAQQPTPARASTPVNAALPTMAKPELVFMQHQQTVRTVGWSPDGMSLASGADDTQLFIWGTDGTVRRTLDHAAPVRALAWSPDGQRLVSGAGTRITFFNALTGRMLAHNHRHVREITSLAWTAHNQMQVVSGSLDMRAIVWNTTNYRAQTTFTLHTAPIEAVCWAMDGQTVASSSQGGVVRVWNAATAQEVHGLYFDNQVSMHALAFAPTGAQLAVGGDDGKVRLWNGLVCQQQMNGNFGLQCMDAPRRLPVSNTPIRALAWSPDARFLAAGADDGTLSLWYPAQSQKPLLTIRQNAPVYSIAWSPGSNQLASASANTVTLWKLM